MSRTVTIVLGKRTLGSRLPQAPQLPGPETQGHASPTSAAASDSESMLSKGTRSWKQIAAIFAVGAAFGTVAVTGIAFATKDTLPTPAKPQPALATGASTQPVINTPAAPPVSSVESDQIPPQARLVVPEKVVEARAQLKEKEESRSEPTGKTARHHSKNETRHQEVAMSAPPIRQKDEPIMVIAEDQQNHDKKPASKDPSAHPPLNRGEFSVIAIMKKSVAIRLAGNPYPAEVKVGDRFPDGEVLKSIDMTNGVIITDKREIKL